MKVAFFGTPEYAVPSLEKLLNAPEIDVVGVVTQPDKRRGRGGQLCPSPVKTVALAHTLPLWQPRRIKSAPDVIQALQATQADVFVVVAYGQILSQAILDIPRLGSVNAHGSLLPFYRGAAPIQWCLYNGETETGVTTMLMDVGMDTGAMLLKRAIAISPLINAQALALTLAEISADLLLETILKLEAGALTPVAQDDPQATYARLIQKVDYSLDWSRTAWELHNQIRGFFPHCVASFQDQPLKVLASVPLDPALIPHLTPELESLTPWLQEEGSVDNAPPGTVVGLAKGWGVMLQTGKGQLLLTEVQPHGKRPQRGWDFVNGQRLSIGDRLENGLLLT